jgi:hypothetical protein
VIGLSVIIPTSSSTISSSSATSVSISNVVLASPSPSQTEGALLCGIFGSDMKCTALVTELPVVPLRDEFVCESGESPSVVRVVDASRGGVFTGT